MSRKTRTFDKTLKQTNMYKVKKIDKYKKMYRLMIGPTRKQKVRHYLTCKACKKIRAQRKKIVFDMHCVDNFIGRLVQLKVKLAINDINYGSRKSFHPIRSTFIIASAAANAFGNDRRYTTFDEVTPPSSVE